MSPPQDRPTDHSVATTPDESLVMKVIRTVAVHANVEPEDLPPINNAVDTDALEDIFGPRPDSTPRRGTGTVVFRYAGYGVRVDADGTVEVEPWDERN